MKKNPMIVALGVASASAAMKPVRRLGDAMAMYKVGLELYAAGGRAFVEQLRAEGHEGFFDLKHASFPVMRGAVEGRGQSVCDCPA